MTEVQGCVKVAQNVTFSGRHSQPSRRAMAELVGISESGVKYHLKKLKKEGKITHVVPTKKGYWKIN